MERSTGPTSAKNWFGWCPLVPGFRDALWGIPCLLVWLSLITLPLKPAATGIDASFRQALGFALRHRMQAGIDYIFTFGPLGYFYISPYDTALFWPKIVWELIVKLVVAVLLVAVARRLKASLDRLLFLGTTIILLPQAGFDALYYLGLLAAFVILLQGPVPDRHAGLVLLLFMALVSLVKFTFLILSLISLAGLVIDGCRKKTVVQTIRAPILFGLMFAVLWLACGQSPLHLPAYLTGSLETVRGHSSAMINSESALADCAGELPWGLATLILATAGGLVWWLRERGARGATTSVLVMGAYLFLFWKSGFVRPHGHTPIFFISAALILFFLPQHSAQARYNGSGSGSDEGAAAGKSVLTALLPPIRFAVLGAGLCGLFVAGQRLGGPTFAQCTGAWLNRTVEKSVRLATLHRVRIVQERNLEKLRSEFDLPKIRRRVGSQTVDIMAHRQGVLLLNRMNWHPRPVFQSYLAYTPSLLEANARFYASDDAPEFVIFRLQTVDGRFKTMDDGTALVELLRRYDPVTVEHSYVLFRKHDRGAVDKFLSPGGCPILQQSLAFGEDLILPPGDTPRRLSIDIRYSLRGRARTLLYRAPSVSMTVEDGTGHRNRYTIIPPMCRSGFIINPLLRNQRELISWLAGEEVGRACVLRIDVSPEFHSCFKPLMEIRVEPIGGIHPQIAETVQRRFLESLDHAAGKKTKKTWSAPGKKTEANHDRRNDRPQGHR